MLLFGLESNAGRKEEEGSSVIEDNTGSGIEVIEGGVGNNGVSERFWAFHSHDFGINMPVVDLFPCAVGSGAGEVVGCVGPVVT